MSDAAWTWTPDDGPRRLREALARDGFVCCRMADDAPARAANAPWTFARTLLGAEPRMVERQPIRAVPGGRSFASTDVLTPLHTDSQLHLGAPPDAQVMVCARAADEGGETTLVDAWALARRIEGDDPALFRALFDVSRRIPFVFGDVYGPTLALRGAALAFTHSPMAPGDDAIARALAARLDATPPVELRVRTGDVLVVDNRRMLHGRRAFRDNRREFVRLLAWLDGPLGVDARLHAHATQAAQRLTGPLAGADAAVRARFGVTAPVDERRLGVVLEMLRGTPPGVLSAREKLPEAELYRWRDAAVRAAAQALEALPTTDAHREALGAALAAARTERHR